MKLKVSIEPDDDEMDEMEDDEDEYESKKGAGKKALHAALMERMMGKKKHSPRCQCAKCAKKKG